MAKLYKFYEILQKFLWGRSSAGRAQGWQSWGQEFDPPRLQNLFLKREFMNNFRIFLFVLFIFLISLNCFAKNRLKEKLDFRDTKQIVKLVNAAAELIEIKGETAFDMFRVKNSIWYNKNLYIFVDDISGIEVVNPVLPALEGKNILDMQDKWGKYVVRDYIREVYRYGKNKSSGWYHYLWPDPTTGQTTWKTTYVVAVISPSKMEYVVGIGMHNLKMEKAFMIDAVEDAGKLLQTQGKQKGLEIIKSKAEKYWYKDTFVFVTNEKGDELANPTFDDFGQKIDITTKKDLNDVLIFQDMVKIAKEKKEGWLFTAWPSKIKDSPVPVIKQTYIKVFEINGESFIIGTTSPVESK